MRWIDEDGVVIEQESRNHAKAALPDNQPLGLLSVELLCARLRTIYALDRERVIDEVSAIGMVSDLFGKHEDVVAFYEAWFITIALGAAKLVINEGWY